MLDKKTIERMEGVIHTQSSFSMQRGMAVIIQNLIDEGFHEEDIYEYLRSVVISRIDDADWGDET